MKQFFGQDWRSRVKDRHANARCLAFGPVGCGQELNASDERGISAVREKAREFPSFVMTSMAKHRQVKTFAQLTIGPMLRSSNC